MGARYYRNIWGRFTSVDPAGGSVFDPQSFNRYAYARNNPLTLVDPSGADPAGAICQATSGPADPAAPGPTYSTGVDCTPDTDPGISTGQMPPGLVFPGDCTFYYVDGVFYTAVCPNADDGSGGGGGGGGGSSTAPTVSICPASVLASTCPPPPPPSDTGQTPLPVELRLQDVVTPTTSSPAPNPSRQPYLGPCGGRGWSSSNMDGMLVFDGVGTMVDGADIGGASAVVLGATWTAGLGLIPEGPIGWVAIGAVVAPTATMATYMISRAFSVMRLGASHVREGVLAGCN